MQLWEASTVGVSEQLLLFYSKFLQELLIFQCRKKDLDNSSSEGLWGLVGFV
jgi:hypothetical protein